MNSHSINFTHRIYPAVDKISVDRFHTLRIHMRAEKKISDKNINNIFYKPLSILISSFDGCRDDYHMNDYVTLTPLMINASTPIYPISNSLREISLMQRISMQHSRCHKIPVSLLILKCERRQRTINWNEYCAQKYIRFNSVFIASDQSSLYLKLQRISS